MSRVGGAPISLVEGVGLELRDRTVVVTGPKGTLQLELPDRIDVRSEDGLLHVERPDDSAASKSLHGLTRTLLQNMVTGVTNGFSKELRIHGVGYRVTESTKDTLELALGFSHPVRIEAPEGVEFEVPQRTQIIVKGMDKQLVGQVAADIRRWRQPEPYKGKGIRYSDERVRRKAGKAAK